MARKTLCSPFVEEMRRQLTYLRDAGYGYQALHVYVSGVSGPWEFSSGDEFEFHDDTGVLIVRDGDFVDDIEVIATPGHTSEHVCYLTPDRDLFTGDTILGFGTTAIFPPDGNMADYLRSLHKLRAKNPRRIFPAHGPTRDDAVALIDEYIAHRLQREQQVLAAIVNGAETMGAMRKAIYPDLDPRLERGADVQLSAHLIKLSDEGRVAERDGRWIVANGR